MYKNIILAVIGIGVVGGLGFLVVTKSNEPVPEPVLVYPEPVEEPSRPAKDPVNNPAQFNQDVTLRARDSVTLPDGLNVRLKEINDSRCPEGVQCIWAGEISGTLLISEGKLSKPSEVHLGMMTTKTVTVENYTFTLKEAIETSITFKVVYKNPSVSIGLCYVGGCSSQICSDQKDVVSTCEWKEEYACYKTAKCERQTNGQCGWTQTATLAACLAQ